MNIRERKHEYKRKKAKKHTFVIRKIYRKHSCKER